MKKKPPAKKPTHDLPDTVYVQWKYEEEYLIVDNDAGSAANNADGNIVGVYRLDRVVRLETKTSVVEKPV